MGCLAALTCSAPFWVAKRKGLAYRLNAIESETRHSPEYLKLHPFGRIPVMEHSDFRLYETQAILRYIDTLGSTSAPALQPRVILACLPV